MPKPARPTPPPYPVAGVGNVLQLLLLLADRHTVKLTDVSSELGIGPSTAHRLLAMLLHYGFVEQGKRSHAYRVGPGLANFAQTLTARQRMLLRIGPVLERLATGLNETVHVATLHGSTVVYVDCVESRKSERATPRTGRVLPSYATASGKALLAGLSHAEIEQIFPQTLAPLTSHTLVTREALLEDIARTRERGFAINENESQLGFFSCAAAVAMPDDAPPAALVIAAPSARFRKNRYRFAERVCQAAVEAAQHP
jgi:DNA-binding IclR family transcriptional regulator